MNFMQAMALLWMGSMLTFVWTMAARHMDGDAQRSCQRRGCRRMPAGQGCNHTAAGDGVPPRTFHLED